MKLFSLAVKFNVSSQGMTRTTRYDNSTWSEMEKHHYAQMPERSFIHGTHTLVDMSVFRLFELSKKKNFYLFISFIFALNYRMMNAFIYLFKDLKV